MVVGVALAVSMSFTSYSASKAGLEECPQFWAGQGGNVIWTKSCAEYTNLVNNKK